jgi:hypothetical protein
MRGNTIKKGTFKISIKKNDIENDMKTAKGGTIT